MHPQGLKLVVCKMENIQAISIILTTKTLFTIIVQVSIISESAILTLYTNYDKLSLVSLVQPKKKKMFFRTFKKKYNNDTKLTSLPT